MLYCDVALSYTETSGGIRTYIDNKRRYLLEHTSHEHLLIVPDEDDEEIAEERAITCRIASPVLPGCAPYRFFVRPGAIKEALLRHRPDVVELANFFVCPWAAFAYRDDVAAGGGQCTIGGYFHTDVADAYVAAPIRETLCEALGGWSELLESLGNKIADVAETSMESYIKAVFDRCDLSMAASPSQVARLEEYGVTDAHVIPLGVDLELFDPGRRNDEVRQRFDAGSDSLLLIYGGRLDQEKHVDVIVDALELLTDELDLRLLILGEGPLREHLLERARSTKKLHVLPYEKNREAFAELLASCDIYVTAGPHETFALSVAEAQAAGLPVVGVEAGALQERVSPGLGALGPVDDAHAMANNIRQVAAKRAELGRNARRHSEENYGWPATFQKLLALYDKHRSAQE